MATRTKPSSKIMDDLITRLQKQRARNERERRRYWKIRNAVIDYLGGECVHCHTTDRSVLQVHHVEPRLAGGWKKVSGGGAAILREWKRIIRGEVAGKLCCDECHIPLEHGGDSNKLKSVKRRNTRMKNNESIEEKL